ncbi:DNA alkylation repair protein [Spirosoma sp. KUDC1026]|uniref:DNA alkylation repair protein n=1 Tax=Spirosoma sp. KUDC1026 TaxID=2745947 RepID=UPI00159BD5B8|nr:DNA alkylation repair protein [Spirosoma sp. KUDC1026]QKZ12692.1 DNA alkylation repair protein [Spirosoma sp. KUDC1026]
MSSLLKDLYSVEFYNRLVDSFQKSIPGFNKSMFLALIFQDDFERKELKGRMKHTANVLHRVLPVDYPQAVALLPTVIPQLRADGFQDNQLEFMFLPDYIETYGLDYCEESIDALEYVTQFVSCEFAVRPFLLRYGNRMLDQMTAWSRHESYRVRRLASEGSRPRLPWAMAVPALKQNPQPLLALLENLKNDPHPWVRRSVANHLNDIAKDHPELVLSIAANWRGISPQTDAIIKHGCRTLLKQGHPDVLTLYGLSSENLHLFDFTIQTPTVQIGENLVFSFRVHNDQALAQLVRLEYAVYYRKQNGLFGKKVFKISERVYQPNEWVVISRNQRFKPITTRTFYTGQHRLSIILNGQEKEIQSFELIR